MKRIRAFASALKRGLVWTLLAPPRSVRWIYRKIVAGVRITLRGIKNGVLAVLRSPRAAYNKARSARDWLLAKVDYLQSESAKWKTVFNIAKSPYSLLRTLGLSPAQAASFLVAGSVATSGVVVNETILAEKSFSNGDPGIYAAPSDVPVFFEEQFNTLRLDLSTTSVGLIEITDMSLGTSYTGSALPSGETNVIIVGGLPTVADPAFTGTYLEVGHMIVDRWRCETLTLSNIEAHKLIVSANYSDGQSIAAVPGTPRDRGVNGGNRASDMKASDSYYDQLKITAATSGVNGKVDVLKLSNLYSRGGGCKLDRIKAGTLEVILNEIGGDENLATKAFVIEDTVVYKSFTNTANVEGTMPVPAVQ
jgi:hypothetical protein